MDAERWARIKPIFYAAAERPADERAAFIRSQCDGDETLATAIGVLAATTLELLSDPGLVDRAWDELRQQGGGHRGAGERREHRA